MISSRRRAIALVLSGLLGGCSLTQPPRPAAMNLPQQFGRDDAAMARPLSPAANSAPFWQNPTLKRWLRAGLRHNPSLQSSLSSLQAAHEQTLAQKASLLPSFAASYTPQRATTSAILASPLQYPVNPYTLQTAQVSVSYNVDVFGLNHDLLYSVEAQEQLAQAQLHAARLSLLGNIASNAVQLAAALDGLQCSQSLLQDEQRLTQMLQHGLDQGFNTRLDVLQQEQQEQQAAASVSGFQKQVEQSRDALAVLTGQAPANFAATDLHLAELLAPGAPPRQVPAAWVRRRPDIAAAAAQVRTAAADLGVAAASRWPQLAVLAAWGGSATTLAQSLQPADRFWSLGASVTQPLFDFGLLKHRERAAKASLDAAEQQYRMTVLQALQNVADSLYALNADAQALRQTRRQTQDAATLLQMSQQRQQLGFSPGLEVLQNRILWQQAELTRLQAEAARLEDRVALDLALGTPDAAAKTP